MNPFDESLRRFYVEEITDSNYIPAPYQEGVEQFDIVQVVSKAAKFLYIGCVTFIDLEDDQVYIKVDRNQEYWLAS